MIRTRRSLAWSLILVLLCASFSFAQQPPSVRAAANTYVVDNATDADLSGPACTAAADDCSLRQAIKLANTDGGSSEIQFDIPADENNSLYGYNQATGRWTITPISSLPPLNAGSTTIKGRNDNAVGTPRIVIDGSGLSGGGVGLRLNSSTNVVLNLVIVGFTGSATTGIGIRIDGPNTANNQVYGNYIGNFPGATALANAYAGIQLDNGAHDNTIGTGSNPGERNVIAGNSGDGIRVQNAPNNKIYGNYIGLGLNSSFSTVELPNSANGIRIVDSSGTQVGGAQSQLRNVVSGNAGDGIVITGDGSTNNSVAGNYIGLNELGAADQGNTGNGVTISDGASNNSVFGSTGVSSVISGNGGYGVLITDVGTAGNKLYGNYIGVSAGGSTRRANDKGGVFVRDNASNNRIGLSGQGNTISGNTGYGIAFGRTAQGYTAIYSNTLIANTIGLSALGTTVVSNTLGGVLFGNGATNNHLGGASTAEQNVIAGNGGPGVTIGGSDVLSNTVTGNIIGLRRASVNGALVSAAANSGDGVLVNNGAVGTRVGGSSAEANTIGSNTGSGVHVAGAATKPTTIKQNYIGVVFNANAFVAAPNSQYGVLVDAGAQQVTIQNNHISRNLQKGIALVPNSPAPGGSAGNANHDIDAPFNIHLNQNGLLTGRVVTSGTTDACVAPCTVQIFTADPAALDGQGRDFLNEQVTSNGYFTVTLSRVPEQIALTATDKNGNTSEFATLKAQIGPIDLLDAAPSTQSAIPGQVVTYTHQLVNNGTIDLVDLKLKAVSSRKWLVSTVPISGTQFALAAGETRLVTVTLRLPFGPDPRVLAGPPPDQTVVSVTSTRYITVTDSATDTTNVLPKFLLDVNPKTRTGFGAPDSPSNIVRYVHKLTNRGNVARTVQVQIRRVRGWQTEVSTDTLLLEPGDDKAKNLTVSVTVPSGTQAGIAETTYIDLIVPAEPSQNQTITDTTIAELTPAAFLIQDGEPDGEAGAGAKATFFYIVENRSNGTATFSLEGSAAFGSAVSFRRTDGGSFGPNYSFTVGNSPGANTIRFAVEVVLDKRLTIGRTETVTVLLLDNQLRVRQAAQNRIFINRNAMAPRQYLPYMHN